MKLRGAGFPTCKEPTLEGRLGNLPHRRARLGRLRQFVESVVGEAGVFHVCKTATKIDVGYWLGKRRVWACLLEKDLLLCARGRRPYVERIPLAELRESRYNHVTGQLVLAPIEAAAVKGKGQLKLTGSLGDVMKESAVAALTWLRSPQSGVEGVEALDYHVHVPAGAVPKDGPSAGTAILTALASAVTGRLVRHDVAVTGEITLRGQVLPVGGIREKVLAAARAGVKQVVLPKRNEIDLDEVPDEIRKKLTFHLADRVDEVLAVALKPVRRSRSPRVGR